MIDSLFLIDNIRDKHRMAPLFRERERGLSSSTQELH